MKRFSKFLSSSLCLALVAAALPACDSAPVEAPRLQFETLRAATPGAAIAADAKFVDLLEVGLDIAAGHIQNQVDRSDEEIDAIARMLQHPDYASNFQEAGLSLSDLAVELGMEPASLAQYKQLTEQLIETHGLSSATPEVVQAAFSEAMATAQAQTYMTVGLQQRLDALGVPTDDGTGSGSSGSDGGSTGGDDCEDPCFTTHVTALAAASATFLAALAGATGTSAVGGPFAVLAAIIIVTTTYAIAVAKINRAQKECREECLGLDLSDECILDSDCNEDEFCYRGPLGFGKNECREDKGESQLCSRHDQCNTDCCKLHITMPFSKQCRPADRCD